MVALLALALLGYAAWRLCSMLPRSVRILGAAAGTVALACALLQLLQATTHSVRAPDPLIFDGVRVWEEHSTSGRARPSWLLACALLLFSGALALPVVRRASRWPRISGWIWAAAVPYALTLFGGLAAPPRGYDALWYHLPQAVHFWRSHELTPAGRDLVFYFPGNGELLTALGAEIFGPRALPLVQWPFAFGSALAAFCLARALGVRRGAWLAAALVLAAPMVVFQSQLAYVDLIALFGLGAAAALLLRAGRALSSRAAALQAGLGGLSLGLAVGTKLAALFWAASLALPLGLHFLFSDGNLRRPRVARAVLLLSLVTACALVPSLYWFARNHHLSGNPLFPVDVPQLGWHGLFRSTRFNPGKELELVPSRWSWLIYPWIEKISHESGLGAGFAALALPGAAVSSWAVLRALFSTRRRGRLPRAALPLTWGVLGVATWFLATPHEARHLLPLVILWGAPAAALLDSAPLRKPMLAVSACAILFSTLFCMRTLLRSPAAELSARPRTFSESYDLPPAIWRRIPSGAKVANRAGRPFNFPLLGPQLDFRLHDWSPQPPSAEELRYLGVQYLVHRGAPGLAVPGMVLLAEEPVHNLSLWETSPADVVALYQWLPDGN
jgi:hypothetical protein